MPAVIGVLMLMGIVTKNSILLVEYAIVARRDRGMGRFDALIDACQQARSPDRDDDHRNGRRHAAQRAGAGREPSFRQPMAIVVIGGLLTSTALSLLVVPVIFTYVDDSLAVGAWPRVAQEPHTRCARAGPAGGRMKTAQVR